MNKNYGPRFYEDRHQKTAYSARTVISLLLDVLPPIGSAADFGCGVGSWLSILKERGVSEIRGLDGPWVGQELLEIPREDFRAVDFELPIALEKRYDLALSLEVAEHISQESSGIFIDSLVGASDFVLFSAAIPFQGGTGHINEQWPDYWSEMFEARNYVALDFLRKKIWNDERIPFWYRQNIILYVKKEKLSAVRKINYSEYEHDLPIAVVHPDFYLSKMGQMSSVRGILKLLRRAVKAWIKKRISKS